MTLQQQERMISALLHAIPASEANAVPRLLQTHISYVVLTGRYAYKIKKAVNLGFLDFTDLQTRRFLCHEELRLNRRCAPALYQAVVPITGSVDQPCLAGRGMAIEYALQMVEFPQRALATNLLRSGELTAQDIDQLADHIAACHRQAETAGPATDYGSQRAVEQPALQNFEHIAALAGPLAQLDTLERWTRERLTEQEGLLAARKRQGFVREGHGDLHLGNIVRYGGELRAFDCIEFDPALRWLDVMSDIAFLAMDLDYRKREDLSARFVNRYLEITGDYGGVPLLDFFQVYRAVVRAKVALIASKQSDADTRSHDFDAHIALALRYAQPRKAALIVTHGFSGSGKTTLSQGLVELVGAIRIRSDLERKRRFGLDALARTGSALGAGLYSEQASADTYQHLRDGAKMLLEAGRTVIVDAAFLRREARDSFRALAQALAVPFAIVDFTAPVAELRRRVVSRAQAAVDASEADVGVLEHQLKTHDPLAEQELPFSFSVDASSAGAAPSTAALWRPLLERLFEAAGHA